MARFEMDTDAKQIRKQHEQELHRLRWEQQYELE
jgi:hypothetical protein